MAMDTCFICMLPTTYDDQDVRSLQAGRGTDDNLETMRILCQLLRIRSEDVLNVYGTSLICQSLPFCSSCVAGVRDLISLRHKLVKLETEMLNRIRDLHVKIAMTIDENEKDTFNLEQNTQNCQSIFRKQVFEAHQANELLRQKILELREKTLDRETDPLDADYVIGIEPAFVQLQLGSRKCRSLGKSARKQSAETPRSKHFNGVNGWAALRLEVEDDCNTDENKMNVGEIEESNNWIDNQNGPLTRLRLSSGLPKMKKIAIEIRKSSSPDVETKMKSEAEDDNLEEDGSNESGDVCEDSDSDFQVEQDMRKRDSNFQTLIQRSTTSSSKIFRGNGRKVNRKPSELPSRRQWPAEEFNEITTSADGRLFYEGFEIERSHANAKSESFILRCGSCPKEIDKKTAASHQRSPYRMMQVHIKAEHLNAYTCKECGRSLRDYRILRQHTEKKHPPDGIRVTSLPRVFGSTKMPPEVVTSEDGRVEFQGIEIRRVESEGGDYDVVCGVCGKLFNKMASRRYKQCPYRQMLNHIKGVHLHSFRCPFCDKKFRNSKTFKLHVKKHSRAPEDSECEICGKLISGEGYKKKHMWSHKNEEEKELALKAGEKGPRTYGDLMEKRKEAGPAFQCSECGKTFHFGANLRRHENVHKKEIREHQCGQCGKSYCTSESLKSHIKYIHETERVHKKYRCNFCPKRFVTKSPWMKHERTHTKAIPYHCPTCNKGFALKQSLTSHVRNKKCSIGQQRSAESLAPRRRRRNKEVDSARSGPLPQSTQEDATSTATPNPNLHPLQHPFSIIGLPLPAHQNNLPTTSVCGPFSFPSTYPRSLDPNYIQQPQYDAYLQS